MKSPLKVGSDLTRDLFIACNEIAEVLGNDNSYSDGRIKINIEVKKGESRNRMVWLYYPSHRNGHNTDIYAITDSKFEDGKLFCCDSGSIPWYKRQEFWDKHILPSLITIQRNEKLENLLNENSI